MAPSYTRIVSLLLLLAIHAVGVLSNWGPYAASKDQGLRNIQNDVLAKVSREQALHLERGGLYYKRNDEDVNLPEKYFQPALEHAKKNGVKYVDSRDRYLYFYSIIEPKTNLGKELNLKSLGKHAYSSVLWEYNPNDNKIDIVSVARVQPTIIEKQYNPNFKWKLQPFEEALRLVH
ncbi:hypothetical protein NDA11_003103 [Ustilago hordei]|nr:hypothetical protein NDA11_003103 [Ustilago hordei]